MRVHPSNHPANTGWALSVCKALCGVQKQRQHCLIVGEGPSWGQRGALESWRLEDQDGEEGWGGEREGQGPSTAPSSQKLVTLCCARSAVQPGAFSPGHAPHSAAGFTCDSPHPHRPLGVGGVPLKNNNKFMYLCIIYET